VRVRSVCGAGRSEREAVSDMLKPSLPLLVKLGSIVVHAQELTSPDGHVFDRVAMETLLRDPDVRAWLADMDKAAMLPKMRKQ
jgi:hypothetical protein